MRLRVTSDCNGFVPNLWHTASQQYGTKGLLSNNAPDALSCYPIWQPHPGDVLAEYDENSTSEPSIAEIKVLAESRQQESTYKKRKQALEDGEYQQLKEIILQGFPDHRSLLSDSARHTCRHATTSSR